jgi:hypothetical protein
MELEKHESTSTQGLERHGSQRGKEVVPEVQKAGLDRS